MKYDKKRYNLTDNNIWRSEEKKYNILLKEIRIDISLIHDDNSNRIVVKQNIAN